MHTGNHPHSLLKKKYKEARKEGTTAILCKQMVEPEDISD